MSGYLLHQDSQRVIIATDTRESDANAKIGRMIQGYILVAGESPVDAVRDGADSLICGDCSLRGKDPENGFIERTCYVRVIQGPLSVWRAWKRGRVSVPAEVAVCGSVHGARGTLGRPW